MKAVIRASVLYLLLIFIYKVIGDYKNNYWINFYWFVSALFYMLVFIKVRSYCMDVIYRRVGIVMVIYWAFMAALRLYLFFDIEMYSTLIIQTSKLSVGSALILSGFIYLTSKLWFKR